MDGDGVAAAAPLPEAQGMIVNHELMNCDNVVFRLTIYLLRPGT